MEYGTQQNYTTESNGLGCNGKTYKYYAYYYNTRRLVSLTSLKEYQKWLSYDYTHVFVHKMSKIIFFNVPSGNVGLVKKLVRTILSDYEAQGLRLNLSQTWVDFLDGCNAIVTGIAKVGAATNKWKEGADKIDEAVDYIAQAVSNRPTFDFLALKIVKTLMDVISLFRYGDMYSMANVLLSFYNLFTDYKVICPESMDALFFSACSTLLPPSIYEVFKRLSLFTNSKLLDDMHALDTLVSIVHEFITKTLVWFKLESYIEVVDSMFSYLPFGKKMVYIKNMRTIVNKYTLDPKSLNDPLFRIRVKESEKKMKQDLDFLEWCKRSQSLSVLLGEFTRLCKNIKGYECALRIEPNCFVFEGPPGCKKSIYTGKLCELLTKKDSMTIYSHLIKSVSDGKDWYDSYNNEDVFLMDDVGQQGISQWRTLINMVSPLRLPLDCAEAKLKDTKFFSSQNIFITTNKFSQLQGFAKNDGISDPHALWRRGFVFDFTDVEMDKQTGTLNGLILFKHYNIDDNSWVNGFPPYVKTNLPTSSDSSDELKTLAWMRKIVIMFDQYKKNFAQETNLTASQLAIIDDITQEFDKNYDGTTEEYYDAETYFNDEQGNVDAGSYFNDYMDHITCVIDLLMEYKTYLLSLVPTYFLSKNYLSLALITLGLGLGYYLGKYIVKSFRGNDITPEAKYNKLKNLFKNETELNYDTAFIHKNIKDVKIKTPHGEFAVTAILSGHYAIVPAHAAFEQHCLMQIVQDAVRNLVLIDYIPVDRVYINQHADVAIYKLPAKGLTPFKQLSHLFEKPKNQDVVLITSMGCIPLMNHIRNDDLSDIYYSNAPQGYEAFSNYITAKERLDYQISCPTLCGSPVFDGSIRGIHVAGNGINGTSVIWSDKVIHAIKTILSTDSYILPMEIKPLKQTENLSATQVDYKFSETTPKDSHYAPTRIFGVFPVEREPADMLYDGPHTVKTLMRKNMSINKPLDLPLYEEAAKGFDCFFRPYDKCTEQEIVDGFELIAKINSKTSNGMFYDGTKDDYIDYENKCFKQSFKEHILDLESEILKGRIPPELVFVKSTLKDEVRDKAKQGKPRAFQVMPLSVQVLTKKYFAKFVQNIIKTRDFHKVSVGINPFKEWDNFYTNIKNHKGFDMDFPDWDGNMLAAAQDIIVKHMMKYFEGTDDDRTVAEVVLRTIIFKVIVCNDDGYLVTHGLPSGSFLTAIVNSLVNLLNGMAWYVKSTGNRSIRFFNDVDYYTYGDDNVTIIKNEKLYDKLNAITYRDFLKDIGIECTTAGKQKVVEPFVPINELVFLKRKFVFSIHLNKMMGALDVKSLLSGLNWYDTSSNDTPDKILRDKIACFQREAFLHGPQFFEEKTQRLREYCSLNGVEYSPLSFEYLVKLYSEDFDTFSDLLMKKYDISLLS